MKIVSLLLAVASLSLVGCGPDSDLVASGKNHACTLAALTVQLEAEPKNEELQAQVQESAAFLQSVVESAGEGDRADLEAAIRDAVAEGCD